MTEYEKEFRELCLRIEQETYEHLENPGEKSFRDIEKEHDVEFNCEYERLKRK